MSVGEKTLGTIGNLLTLGSSSNSCGFLRNLSSVVSGLVAFLIGGVKWLKLLLM